MINPFAQLDNVDHANLLAHAFVCARNLDQVLAVCRFERATSPEMPNLSGYLDGCHFEEWDVYENESSFEELQVLADAFLAQGV